MADVDPRSDPLELILLSILDEEPQYGYAIMRIVKARSEEQIRLTPGVLYPLLARLNAQGLITSRWEEVKADRSDPDAPGRRRKWYSLTAKGRRWLAKRVEDHRAYLNVIESFISGARGSSEAAS